MRGLAVEEMMMIKYRKRAHAILLEPFDFLILLKTISYVTTIVAMAKPFFRWMERFDCHQKILLE